MSRLSLLLALLVGEGLTFQAPVFPIARPSVVRRSTIDLVDDSAAGHDDWDDQQQRDDGLARDNFFAEVPDDADSATRRRLVLSLMTSSSLVPLVGNAATSSSSSTTIAATAESAATQTDHKTYTVIIPPLDKREYVTYTMPNGLNVLLVSDPASTTAACAMNVHVGACSDPAEVRGLAHFCEHMLFLGTELYPDEDSFSKFLSANGGTNNAFTDSEKTVYYYEVDGSIDKRFSESLLRFGSFFSGPLFTESATGRELNAIDSENSKNLQNDIFRLYQLEKSRVNSDHPFSKFFTGNKQTLLEDTKRQGINLRQELVNFYEKYYSANQMNLAVVAPQKISELKKYVSDGFGSIPNRNVVAPENAWAYSVPPFKEGSSVIPAEKSMVEIVPIQELRQVTVTWPVVFASKEERDEFRLNKPDNFVASLLGHEGVGSLLSYLKGRGWANSLGADTNANLSDLTTFEVTVELTNKGLAKIDEIVSSIFSYIQMMKDDPIPDYVFDENLQLDELQWRYTTKGKAGPYAESLAISMQAYPTGLAVAGPRRLALRETRSSLINDGKPRMSFASNEQRDIIKDASRNLIEKLTVDDSFLTVFSKSFQGKTNQKEKWYGTEYNVRPIPSSTLLSWRNCASATSLGLAYPRPNVFIPSEQGLRVKKQPRQGDDRARTFQEKIKPIPPPSIIRDDGDEGRWTVYFKQDDIFGKPKAFLIFSS